MVGQDIFLLKTKSRLFASLSAIPATKVKNTDLLVVSSMFQHKHKLDRAISLVGHQYALEWWGNRQARGRTGVEPGRGLDCSGAVAAGRVGWSLPQALKCAHICLFWEVPSFVLYMRSILWTIHDSLDGDVPKCKVKEQKSWVLHL